MYVILFIFCHCSLCCYVIVTINVKPCRNLDLELELSEIKNLLTRMEGNSAANDLASSKIDNLTRAELNRTMSDWSGRLQTLLESERGKLKTGDCDSQLHAQLKMRVHLKQYIAATILLLSTNMIIYHVLCRIEHH